MNVRDKFLTEEMGLCWHEYPKKGFTCKKCHATDFSTERDNGPEFNSWDGFGILWEWAQKQEWWGQFWTREYLNIPDKGRCFWESLINPSRFADALYKYLRESHTVAVP